jgi:hypothetical protein
MLCNCRPEAMAFLGPRRGSTGFLASTKSNAPLFAWGACFPENRSRNDRNRTDKAERKEQTNRTRDVILPGDNTTRDAAPLMP